MTTTTACPPWCETDDHDGADGYHVMRRSAGEIAILLRVLRCEPRRAMHGGKRQRWPVTQQSALCDQPAHSQIYRC